MSLIVNTKHQHIDKKVCLTSERDGEDNSGASAEIGLKFDNGDLPSVSESESIKFS